MSPILLLSTTKERLPIHRGRKGQTDADVITDKKRVKAELSERAKNVCMCDCLTYLIKIIAARKTGKKSKISSFFH